MWDPNRPTHIEVDASGYATGGVIAQKGDDNLWHPIAFRSQSMNDAEKSTKSTTEKCSPSQKLWKTGVTISKVFPNRLKSGLIIRTWNFGALPNILHDNKLAGLFFLQISISC